MRIPQRLRHTDLPIIACLRADACIQLADIAKATKQPVSTIHDRLKVIDTKLVKRRITHIQFPYLGYMIRCYTAIKVKQADRDALEHFLTKHPHINMLLQINNGYDFLVETYYPQLQDFEKFLNKLTHSFRLRHCQPFYVIEELVAERFFSNPHALPEVHLP